MPANKIPEPGGYQREAGAAFMAYAKTRDKCRCGHTHGEHALRPRGGRRDLLDACTLCACEEFTDAR